MNNEVLKVVINLSWLLLPFLFLVSINTEFFTSLTGWKDKKAKITSSVIGLLFGILILLYFLNPEYAVYVGAFFFLDMCIVGPSGGHDLIKKFAEKFGK